MLGIHSLALEQLAHFIPQVTSCLFKLLLLPTLGHEGGTNKARLAKGGGLGAASGGPAAIDIAAAHASMALWALSSNPMCGRWAEHIASDPSGVRVLLAIVKRGQKGGTRARFAAARLFAAATLGQLIVQDRVDSDRVDELMKPENGIVSVLVDLMTLAVPPVQQGGRGDVRGSGGRGGRGGTDMAQIMDTARSAALQSAGLMGDLRCTLGLQVMGILSHMLAIPTCAQAILADPGGCLANFTKLLNSSHEDVMLVAIMALGVLTAAGGEEGRGLMTENAALLAAILHTMDCKNPKIAAYAAVTVGNLALDEEAAEKLVTSGCLTHLTALLLSPVHVMASTLPSSRTRPASSSGHGEEGGLRPVRPLFVPQPQAADLMASSLGLSPTPPQRKGALPPVRRASMAQGLQVQLPIGEMDLEMIPKLPLHVMDKIVFMASSDTKRKYCQNKLVCKGINAIPYQF
eukprot:gene28882-32073_t